MISVVIPTYKNKAQLLENLKNNLPHLKACEIIIINDDPDSSIESDLNKFDIVLIENEKNLGFGESVNKGVKMANGSHIILLNSDVVLHDRSYENALEQFNANKTLFAVTFAQKEVGGKIVGKNSFFWSRGMFYHKKSSDLLFGITGWAEGGSCLIDKKKFALLSGFDSLYSPFYWEDIDLSYRAWKQGFEIIFDPSIIVTHHHESTIGKYFSKKQIKVTAFRNQFIFIWKNITDFHLIVLHIILLPLNMVYYMLKKESNFVKGFFGAVQKLGTIIEKRSIHHRSDTHTDVEILKKLHD